MDGINADLHSNGIDNGAHDNDNRNGIDEHAGNEEEYRDNSQHQGGRSYIRKNAGKAVKAAGCILDDITSLMW